MKAWPFLYSWLLPLVWAVSSVVSFHFYHGDEYSLWALASFPGLWWALITGMSGDIHQPWIPLVTALCGALVIAPLGVVLDRFKLNIKVFAVIWWLPFLAVTTQMIYKYGSIPNAIQKQGSFGAFVCAGVNISILFTSLLAIAWLWWSYARERAKERGRLKKES